MMMMLMMMMPVWKTWLGFQSATQKERRRRREAAGFTFRVFIFIHLEENWCVCVCVWTLTPDCCFCNKPWQSQSRLLHWLLPWIHTSCPSSSSSSDILLSNILTTICLQSQKVFNVFNIPTRVTCRSSIAAPSMMMQRSPAAILKSHFTSVLMVFCLMTCSKYSISFIQSQRFVFTGQWSAHVTPYVKKCFHDSVVSFLHMDPCEEPPDEGQNLSGEKMRCFHQEVLVTRWGSGLVLGVMERHFESRWHKKWKIDLRVSKSGWSSSRLPHLLR